MHKDKAKVKKIFRSRKRFNKAYVNIFNMNFFKLTLSNLINFISTIYAITFTELSKKNWMVHDYGKSGFLIIATEI